MAGQLRRWAFRFTAAFLAFVFCVPSLALLDLVVGLLPAGPASELPECYQLARGLSW